MPPTPAHCIQRHDHQQPYHFQEETNMNATFATLVVTSTFGAMAAFSPPVVQAQDSPAPLRLENSQTMSMATAEYWNADRLASAQPMRVNTNFAAESFTAPLVTGSPRYAGFRKPERGVQADPTQLFDPARVQIDTENDIAPNNAGTLNAHFSSTRLVPTTANTAYPYRTVGKLFFSDGVGNFVCSASVISYRVVVTAGHCVHRGSGGAAGFYRNFLFVPALKNGVAPFGTWNWAFVTVTGTWAAGGGTVPNAADYAMFEFGDRATLPNRIGSVTGFLGWRTLSLSQNHTTMLGYPCNFDSCQQLHQVSAGAFRNTSPNNVEYGSDARGGSSGGPWIQNFGTASVGQFGGNNPGLNRVVGVTSYGYVSPDPKVQGASVPDSRWVQLWNVVCAHRVGNCTP
jgi:V8-like Glu-specific endopeptidase